MTTQPIEQVLREHTDSLMAVPGVVGVAIADCGGNPCIRVMVEKKTAEIARRVPQKLGGYGVDIAETGKIRAR